MAASFPVWVNLPLLETASQAKDKINDPRCSSQFIKIHKKEFCKTFCRLAGYSLNASLTCLILTLYQVISCLQLYFTLIEVFTYRECIWANRMIDTKLIDRKTLILSNLQHSNCFYSIYNEQMSTKHTCTVTLMGRKYWTLPQIILINNGDYKCAQ